MTRYSSHRSGRCHSSRGFTLTEVLIVVACFAVVALLVLPSSGDPDRVLVRAAAQMLIADLQYAQMQSMGNGADPTIVVFEPNAARYHLARISLPTVPLRDPGTGLAYVLQFGQGRGQGCAGVLIDALTVGEDDRLGFTVSGALDQGVDATITLRKGTQTIQVILDPATGEPSVK